MGNIAEVKSPLGTKIIFTEKQFNDHVIKDSGHTIMRDNIFAIAETLRNPDYIYESSESTPTDYRQLFIRKCSGTTYGGMFHTKVAVAVGRGYGYGITAYPSPTITGGTKGEAIYIARRDV